MDTLIQGLLIGFGFGLFIAYPYIPYIGSAEF